MIIDPPADAVTFAMVMRSALTRSGGIELARSAESEPSIRSGISRQLAELGLDEIDVRDGRTESYVAALACLEAGRVTLPYPLPAVLCSQPGRPTASIGSQVAIDHGDLFDTWQVFDLAAGEAFVVEPNGSPFASRLGPFVTPMQRGADEAFDESTASLQLTFDAWYALGALERALELAAEHVMTRVQFGKPLSDFQSVQFGIADSSVTIAGLRELAIFATESCTTNTNSLVDSLSVYLAVLDATPALLRRCQQMHGAAGLTSEYEISTIVRHLQARLRLSHDVDRLALVLADQIDNHGFTSLFTHGHRKRGNE